MKVLTVVGTRPELIKLSRVIAQLDEHTDHFLAHTGQNYDHELNQIFFDQLGIRAPDRYLDAAAPTAAATVANVITRVDELIAEIQPDAFLILGDTNSCLSVISAKRRKVPIFHMEAGNRCFDQRVPEEINRRIIDHTSDINLVYTEHARRYLLNEGVRPEMVIKTGSPMREVIEHHRAGIEASDIASTLGLSAGNFYLVSAHREENVDVPERLSALMASLNMLRERDDIPIVFSVHPRTRARLAALGLEEKFGGVKFLKPLGFLDYVRLQMLARCVISDSGTITEETSLLGLCSVTIRQAHERPEGMDEGTLVMTDLTPDTLLPAVDMVVAQRASGRTSFRVVEDYDVDNVSAKVARIVHSYTDYVNRTVWRK